MGAAADLLKTHQQHWLVASIALLMGMVGLPLGVGLLSKKRYALGLVHLMFGLALLQALIQIPVAATHFAVQGENGSAIFEAELLVVWMLSLVYYRKRRNQFV